jgi:hypothetical protein
MGAPLTQFLWTPGIGDPTLGGWITVALYGLAAASCWATARSPNCSAQERRIWWCILVLFLALAINKQLDLQTALTELGRVIADAQRWYPQRRFVQLGFVIVVATAGMIATSALLIWARHTPVPTWLALVGLTLVIGFVLIRAASFHHIDRFIRTAVLGLRWNWILEMGGIGVVLLASHWRRVSR